MHVIAVANLKGGVGKTATAHALSEAMATNRRVLMIDADPQGSLTNACGLVRTGGRSLVQVLEEADGQRLSIRQAIWELRENLALVPADRELARVEQTLSRSDASLTILREALGAIRPSTDGWARPFSAWSSTHYDLVVIDTPPRMGPLTLNALAAADGLLIPTIPEVVALTSLRTFLQWVREVQRTLNPHLKTIGVLITFHDRRLIHHRSILHMMRAAELPLLDVTIGRSVRVAEAASRNQSIVTYAPEHPRSLEYLVLAEVIRGWLRDHAPQP